MAKQDLMDTIRKLLKERKLEPYLKHIRFPCFRNLEQGLRIDFNFPLTAIVGQNGGNKSSVLRAVYGCPGNNSIGKFWFSTHVDPIDEHGGRPRFIYGYYQPEAKKDVEVIKTRIRKTFERKVNGRDVKRKDPDYWETARPSIRDGMERMPKEGSKTRWKTIKKNVLFMDFRSEISAFDKYF